MDNPQIMGVFDALDADGDGYLRRDEYIAHYRGRGEEIIDIMTRFDEADYDGDGRINVQEFLSASRATI